MDRQIPIARWDINSLELYFFARFLQISWIEALKEMMKQNLPSLSAPKINEINYTQDFQIGW